MNETENEMENIATETEEKNDEKLEEEAERGWKIEDAADSLRSIAELEERLKYVVDCYCEAVRHAEEEMCNLTKKEQFEALEKSGITSGRFEEMLQKMIYFDTIG